MNSSLIFAHSQFTSKGSSVALNCMQKSGDKLQMEFYVCLLVLIAVPRFRLSFRSCNWGMGEEIQYLKICQEEGL